MQRTAVIHLDEIESQLVEKQSAVRRIMSVQTRTHARPVPAVACAGVSSGIGIRSRLHAERVNAVDHPFQPVRKPHGIESELSIGSMPVEKSVVDVHVNIPGGFKSVRRHHLGDADNNLFGDVFGKRIPARPSHERRLGIRRLHGTGTFKKTLSPRFHRFLLIRTDTAEIDERAASVFGNSDTVVAFFTLEKSDGRCEQCHVTAPG